MNDFDHCFVLMNMLRMFKVYKHEFEISNHMFNMYLLRHVLLILSYLGYWWHVWMKYLAFNETKNTGR